MSEKRYERVFIDTNEFIIFDKQEEHRDKGSLYLSENNILKLLNEQDNEIKQLKKEKENFELIIKDRLKFLKREDVRILGGAEVRELEWVLAILSEKMYVNYDKIRNWRND